MIRKGEAKRSKKEPMREEKKQERKDKAMTNNVIASKTLRGVRK